MQHQTFSPRLLLKGKNLNVLLRTIYSVLLFFFFFRHSKLSCELKTVYGINNKSNGVGVVCMNVTTCVTNDHQMNPVNLQQFPPNLHNWTSVNQLFRAQLASSKRMEIWQTLRFTNKLWNEHTFECGSRAKLFIICMKVNRSIRSSGLWVTEVFKHIRTTPLLLLLIPYMFLVTWT